VAYIRGKIDVYIGFMGKPKVRRWLGIPRDKRGILWYRLGFCVWPRGPVANCCKHGDERAYFVMLGNVMYSSEIR
jgi:hypothetical protein